MSAVERLRGLVAGIDVRGLSSAGDPSPSLPLGLGPVDAALGGGLSFAALHEIAPAAPFHGGAASGFALALAARAAGAGGIIGSPAGERGVVWIQIPSAMAEMGRLYGWGLDGFGLSTRRLLAVRVCRPLDALWVMEEALVQGAGIVIAELPGEGAVADLTATRRLALAARDGGGLGCLVRHQASRLPSAAVTRWSVSAAASGRDRFGGLGRAAFALSLVKNRRGPCGRWIVSWDHHEHAFLSSEALSLALAAQPPDRPDGADARRPVAADGSRRAARPRAIDQERAPDREPQRRRRAAGA